jgi:hypothetical protein
MHFGPEVVGIVPPSSGRAEWLAWESTTDDIDGNSIGSKSLARKGSYIVIAGHLRPVFRQHPPAEWIDFAKGNGLKAARALKAKVEAADPSEQGEDAEAAHSANPCIPATTHTIPATRPTVKRMRIGFMLGPVRES